ncbi:phage tail terminator protein [Devosia sediminis]|uniref:Uncharacterized protein n=1 Tax=Devosia sediminis TaxID=2798801 RepID=A0A934IMD8_9HYPH|nr:hypothetical protein [Devosia sediminis]MBJ3783414.1 hypothetical protein [Devosia sediminis]
MSDLHEIKGRLLSVGTPFYSVRGASTLSQVKDRPDGPLPQAFVIVAEDMAQDNSRATGGVFQRLERDIAIVIVAEHLGDADGADVQDPLEALKDYVRRQLLGWQTSEMVDVITYVRGETMEAVDGCVWFAAYYSAPQYIEEAS